MANTSKPRIPGISRFTPTTFRLHAFRVISNFAGPALAYRLAFGLGGAHHG